MKICDIRDKDEKQALIDRQLRQRQDLQDQVQPILRKHQNIIVQLKKDVAKYMEMGVLDHEALQENESQLDKKKEPNRDQGNVPEM
ncbi:MAG: hypothetical protein MRJ96_00085 [Nitrospirales bacterium]|nr:hypothetical protein [Nitrospira sp.]MDR4499839.1 hypothetical protein [Nitrospirales bacterium]